MAGINQIKISELPTKENPSTNDYLVMDDGSETSRIKALTLFNLCYPVGSIYMSVNDIEPSVLFGGTWEKIKDRFLLASGDTYTIGNIGGEATHTLTVEEMPSHNHFYNSWQFGYIQNGIKPDKYTTPIRLHQGSNLDEDQPNTNTNFTGGGQAHNNMPPYLVVNMWERIS